MRKLQFEVKLLSDVVLQQKSATEGKNGTLDFIPGANFMGIVAAKEYAEHGECDLTYRLFHSGKVRFGDANPGIEGHRTSKMPLTMYHPKFNTIEEACYIHHAIKDFAPLLPLQLKQCRSGYYDFLDLSAVKCVNPMKDLALKSARDAKTRTSSASQMFSYESLVAGATYYFEVVVEEEDLAAVVQKDLLGIHRIGRSRSAEYGLVEIHEASFSKPQCKESQPGSDLVVYADSRLIFLDSFGLPTYQPTPADFGIKDSNACILWEKSQIRTFCYTPWNFKRSCYDSERCGFEKGSVFVIRTSEPVSGVRYVGEYQTEGFGAILVNPLFLQAKADGKALVQFVSADKGQNIPQFNKPTGSILLAYIDRQAANEKLEASVYQMVNEWSSKPEVKKVFQSEIFASQWGQIRRIAMECQNLQQLQTSIADYLTHGVASKRWMKYGRYNLLMDFINQKLNDENARIAIINLASIMAKNYQKGDSAI